MAKKFNNVKVVVEVMHEITPSTIGLSFKMVNVRLHRTYPGGAPDTIGMLTFQRTVVGFDVQEKTRLAEMALDRLLTDKWFKVFDWGPMAGVSYGCRIASADVDEVGLLAKICKEGRDRDGSKDVDEVIRFTENLAVHGAEIEFRSYPKTIEGGEIRKWLGGAEALGIQARILRERAETVAQREQRQREYDAETARLEEQATTAE